nr:hypothetical protein [Tanacetum cinerariifolium]
IREEFRTGSGLSGSDGNPLPVTIHTWLECFNKQKPPAGTAEEQEKNFQWGLHKSTLNHLMCISFIDVAQVANAARNYEILHERDDDGAERGGGDNHRSNNNYFGNNNRSSGECHRAAGTCFKCGQTGHLQKDFKKNIAASTSGQADKKPGASGHVFSITEDHATKTS